MGIFYNTFNEKIKEVWNIANKLDKPINNNLSWTIGLINGRGDYNDLQAHGAALISSIIINEKIVPKIICAWDSHQSSGSTIKDLRHRQRIYPTYLMSLFDS